MKFKTIDDLPDELSEIFENSMGYLIHHYEDLYHHIIMNCGNENIAFNIIINSFFQYVAVKSKNKNSLILAKELIDHLFESAIEIKGNCENER